MKQPLSEIFGELGIEQYLGAFVEQGFDTWDTILDIQESDLDALRVKLGHRRRLQRRIANSRGIAPDAALVSPMRASIEDAHLDAHRPNGSSGDHKDAAAPIVTKRKYRRHPKPDENAPERAPSAYVLFSNKMREVLKDRNLSFTEIAKFVGENWQNLTPEEREPFESQALMAKEKFAQDLAAYKKTSDYQKYQHYLKGFKDKYQGHNQDKEGTKRPKLSESSTQGSGPLAGSSTPPRARSTTGSGDSGHGSEPPPPCRERQIDSVVAVHETRHVSRRRARERSSELSPPLGASPREAPSGYPSRRSTGWDEGPYQHPEPGSGLRSLPPLSDVLDSRPNGMAEADGYVGYPRSYRNGSPAAPISAGTNDSWPPSLRKEYSSAGSISSSYSYPRTPVEGSLPIQALIENHAMAFDEQRLPYMPSGRLDENKVPVPPYLYDRTPEISIPRPPGHGDAVQQGMMANGHGYFSSSPQTALSQPPPLITPSSLSSPLSPHLPVARGSRHEAEGLAALLKAGEMVDRQAW